MMAGTLGTMPTPDALGNLDQDARAYGWNAATVSAIRAGIKLRGFIPPTNAASDSPSPTLRPST
jgi:hypothetical protein